MALSQQGSDSIGPVDKVAGVFDSDVPAPDAVTSDALVPPPPPADLGVTAPPPPADLGVTAPPPPADLGVTAPPPPADFGVTAPPPPADLGVTAPPPPPGDGDLLPPPPADALTTSTPTPPPPPADASGYVLAPPPQVAETSPVSSSPRGNMSNQAAAVTPSIDGGSADSGPKAQFNAPTTTFSAPSRESGMDTFAADTGFDGFTPSVDPVQTTQFPPVFAGAAAPAGASLAEPGALRGAPGVADHGTGGSAGVPAGSSTARIVLRVLSAGAAIAAGGSIALFVMPSVFHMMWPVMWAVIALLGIVTIGSLCEIFLADRFLGFVVSILGVIGGLASAASGVALLDGQHATFKAAQSSELVQLLLLLTGAGAALALCSVCVLAAAAAMRRR